MSERRVFFGVLGLVLVIPGLAGPVLGFFGLEGLAFLFRLDPHVVVSPAMRNHLRAVCWMFFTAAPVVIWSLRDLRARAGAFQIVVACAFIAGFTRLTGRFVDGPPGMVPTGLMIVELVGMPALFLWHRRLVSREQPRLSATT